MKFGGSHRGSLIVSMPRASFLTLFFRPFYLQVGYAYAGAYSSRKAYDWTATTSIYIDKECRRQGIGSLLYDELEKRLKDWGIVNLLAGVASCEEEDEYLSNDSSRFHISKGYVQVAHMKAVGKKFDRWYDLLWFQKRI